MIKRLIEGDSNVYPFKEISHGLVRSMTKIEQSPAS